MGRKPYQTRDEFRKRTIDAAAEIIKKDGVRGLTARKIARAINQSVGSIYYVTRSLDELIDHVNGRTLDGMIEAFAGTPLVGEPQTDITSYVETYLRFEEENRALWAAIFDYTRPPDLDLPTWYAAKIEALADMAERAIAPLFGGTPNNETRMAVNILWAGLHGITSLARSGKLASVAGKDVNPKSMAKHLATNYLAGLLC